MPRKAKETNEEIPVKNTKKDTKKTATKAVNNVTKTTKVTPVSNSKPSGTKTSKKSIITKTDKTKKVAKTTKSNTDKVTKSAKVTKTVSPSVTKTKKPTKSVKTKKNTNSNLVSVIEYYDLPYRYNQTLVKVLAQTPSMLFIYWDISDNDRKNLEEYYGNDFFNKTKPVLLIHNETMNYSFEIEINDFANSWYLHVNDADCKYVIELGRRPLHHVSDINTNYIYISSSNEMTSPNNHILFEKFNPNVTYKNIKSGNISKKDFSSMANYKNMQSIYNIYDLYKTIYKDDLFYEITNEDLTNPSSLSSSSFK